MKHLIILSSFFILISCTSSKKTGEDFSKFNLKFHTDSIFQMERIKFPLKGKFIIKNDNENWSIENWKMLRKPVGELLFAQFEQKSRIEDSIVIEEISYKKIGFYSYVEFKLINKKWYLVMMNKTDLH